MNYLESITVRNDSNICDNNLKKLQLTFVFFPATAQFPAEKFLKSEDEPQVLTADKKQIILNSSDDLFADIRDKNFNAVGPALQRKAKHISNQFEERHGKSIEQMKKFVQLLPQLQTSKKLLAMRKCRNPDF